MAGERDKIVEPSMVEMSKAFEQAERQLDTTKGEAEKLAKMMEDGALQGKGGEIFAGAIRSKLNKKIDKLANKMHELHGDVDKALAAMREAEKKAQQQFK